MLFHTYLVAWDAVHFNSVEIEETFIKAKSPITVINSGRMQRDHWNNVGDIRYYKQFYHALKNFNDSYEYMAFLCGDVSSDKWQHFIDRATYVLTSYSNIGMYAPHLTNEPWSENSCKVDDVIYDENLNISIQTDGIYVFIHKSIVKVLLEYFDHIQQTVTFDGMTSGWGIDTIASSICINNGLAIVRDKEIILNHPVGSSYDHSKATLEMNILLKEFYNFINSIGKDPVEFQKIHEKIYGRMSHSKGCLESYDFYGIKMELNKAI